MVVPVVLVRAVFDNVAAVYNQLADVSLSVGSKQTRWQGRKERVV